jgi:hypothetical protein
MNSTMLRILGMNTRENLGPSPQSKHRVVDSSGTNVSAIADSTITFGGLDDFPQPPLSVPPSPASSSNPEFPRFVRSNLTYLSPLSGPSSRLEFDNTPLDFRLLHERSTNFRQPHREVPPLRDPHPVHSSQSSSRTSAGPLSPYDWHEGSSSIDVDPSDPNLLPTSFITSLLSSPNDGSDSPASGHFRGMQINHAASSNDTTRPPSRPADFLSYPPGPQNASTHMPPGAAYWEQGRKPQYLHTAHYLETVHRSDTEPAKPSVTQTASMSRTRSRTVLVGPRPARSAGSSTMSDIPSMASSLPLLQALGNNQIIEETHAEEQETSPIMHHPKRPNRASSNHVSSFQRTQSTASTKTAKSYMSSLLKRVSHTSSKLNYWRNKPLPPVPDIPSFIKTQDTEHRKIEESLPLPELVSRADALAQMLEKGHRPHSSNYNISGFGASARHWDVLLEPARLQERLENGSKRSWRWSKDGKPQRLETDDDEFKDSLCCPPSFSWSNLSHSSRVRVVIAVAVMIIIIIVATVIGVVVGRKKNSSLPNCPVNTTGAACDLGQSLSFGGLCKYIEPLHFQTQHVFVRHCQIVYVWQAASLR